MKTTHIKAKLIWNIVQFVSLEQLLIKVSIRNANDAMYSAYSKKEGKDQESIQSSTTPDTRYQWESNNFTIRHHKQEPKVRLSLKPNSWGFATPRLPITLRNVKTS